MLTRRKLIPNPVFKERKYESLTFADLFIYLFFNLFFLSVCHLFCSFYVTLSVYPRDDNFSDTLSQKADSEASSGHAGEDKCSGKDIGSPPDPRISEAYITRSVFTLLYNCCMLAAI